jgi:hypothetical protein
MHMLKQEDESQFGDDGDALTNMLYIGDNFVVLAEEGNEEGVQYYLLQCQWEKFVVQEEFEDAWSNHSEMGQHIIEGI